jgi:hypothetical protein
VAEYLAAPKGFMNVMSAIEHEVRESQAMTGVEPTAIAMSPATYRRLMAEVFPGSMLGCDDEIPNRMFYCGIPIEQDESLPMREVLCVYDLDYTETMDN